MCFYVVFYDQIFYCTFKFCCSFLSEINLLAWQQFAVLKLEKADLLSLILLIMGAFSFRATKF